MVAIMQVFWTVLGIEPTDDIRAIKRAYASLAHEINPEDDPDRFRELHEAYKNALEYAKSNVPADEIAGPMQETVSVSSEKEDGQFDFEDFDFEDLQGGTIPANTYADRIIDDIVFFRESNSLTSMQDLGKTPHSVKMSLTTELFGMYRALALATDDVSVWYTFFDEPLVKYCEKISGFYPALMSGFPEESKHRAKINEIIDERDRARRKYFPEYEVSIDPEKEKNEQRLVISLIIAVTGIVLGIVVATLSALKADTGSIITVIGAILLGVILIPVFDFARRQKAKKFSGGKSHGRNRNRSGNDEQSRVHMEK